MAARDIFHKQELGGGGVVRTRLAPEGAGYHYEARLRGLNQATQVAFVALAEGFSPAGMGTA